MRIFQLLLAALFATYLCACGPSRSDSADMDWTQTGGRAGAPRVLGVNAYLWQAGLDTFSFLPVAKADPFGGVIISEWYSPPGSPNERLKVTIYVMDRALRADGLKVMVFRQIRNGSEWQYVQANPDIARKLEDSILTRARQLHLDDRNGKGP